MANQSYRKRTQFRHQLLRIRYLIVIDYPRLIFPGHVSFSPDAPKTSTLVRIGCYMDEPGQLFRHGVFECTGSLYLLSTSYHQTRIRPVPLGLRRTVEYNRYFRLYHERQPGPLRARATSSCLPCASTFTYLPSPRRARNRVLSS